MQHLYIHGLICYATSFHLPRGMVVVGQPEQAIYPPMGVLPQPSKWILSVLKALKANITKSSILEALEANITKSSILEALEAKQPTNQPNSN